MHSYAQFAHDHFSNMWMRHNWDNPNTDYSRQYYQRYEMGPSMVFANANLQLTYTLQKKNGEIEDGKLETPIKSKLKGGLNTWGVIGTSSAKLMEMGEDKILAFGYGGMFNFISWEVGPLEGADVLPNAVLFTAPTGEKTLGRSAVSMHVGVPLSLDYKVGADAILDRGRGMCFTAGAGLYPYVMLSAWGTFEDVTAKAAPFAKIELGYVLGIAFKVRATVISGLTYMSERPPVQGVSNLRVEMKGKPELNLSLLIMPFSYQWEKNRW
ncbi:MAG: hypothetical protein EOP56_14710 [Sphingobacteriales bacterium]|nr:MAG: hypothetical protein EOP56_14710 [Sphingobacteriales bacterium]